MNNDKSPGCDWFTTNYVKKLFNIIRGKVNFDKTKVIWIGSL
jgi:hypothetical protein